MNDQQVANHLAAEIGKVLVEVLCDNEGKLNPTELGDAGDLAGHEFAIHELSKLRPLDHILSEEGEDNVGRLNANRVWIIDPLDGTSHYSKAEGEYAVHVALWQRDSASPFSLSAAAISVPSKKLVIGLDQPGEIPNNSGPIRILVSATRPPDEIEVICSSLKEQFPDRANPVLISMGSVGAKLASIINGQADLYVNTGGFYEWDIAAPAAVAKSHGLEVCDITGQSLNFNKPDTYVPNAIIGRREFVQAVIKSLA